MLVCAGCWAKVKRSTGKNALGEISPKVGKAGPEFIEALLVVSVDAGGPSCKCSWRQGISLGARCREKKKEKHAAGEGSEADGVGASQQPLHHGRMLAVIQVCRVRQSFTVRYPGVDGGEVAPAVAPFLWVEFRRAALLQYLVVEAEGRQRVTFFFWLPC